MLNDAVKIAYNRGRIELAAELLKRIELADTVDAEKVRDLLEPVCGPDINSPDLDVQDVVPDYVISRCHAANDPTRSATIGSRALRSVPDGA